MFRTYVLLQLKRVKKAFPVVFLTAVILMGTLVMLVSMILRMNASTDAKRKAEIGLVGNLSDPYLELGMYALENLDATRFTVEFLPMTEEEAKALLEMGKLTAYAVIPDGLVESVMYGENKKVTYVTAAGSAEMVTVLVEELMRMVSNLLVESQNATYGMQRILQEYGLEEQLWDATDEMNLRYFNLILGRSELFEVEVIGVSNNLSLAADYVCSMILLFLLLWGITCSPLFVKRDLSMQKLLLTRGQRLYQQVLGEYLGYLVMVLFSLFSLGGILLLGAWRMDLMLPEWKYAGGIDLFLFLIRTIPVAAMIAALQLFLFELVSGIVSGVLLQFLGAIVLGYLSGCFYPVSFLPKILQKTAEVLPTGIALTYLNETVTGQMNGGKAAILLLWLFFLLGITIWIRQKKTRIY